MAFFSCKRFFPVWVKKTIGESFIFPRSLTPQNITYSRKIEPGINFYNIFKEHVVHVLPRITIDRQITIPSNRNRVTIFFRIDAETKVPKLAGREQAQNYREIETIIENMLDKLSHQIKDGLISAPVLNMKISSLLTKKQDAWGLKINNVLTKIEEDIDNDNVDRDSIIYM